MARIYLASSWRNKEQPSTVFQLRQAGHQVYDFRNPSHEHFSDNTFPSKSYGGFSWADIDPKWQEWTAKHYIHLLTTSPKAAKGFLNDFRAMQWADTCVLLLPSGRSAHIEAGYFVGANKRLLILTQDGEEPELMYLMANHICSNPIELLEALR